MLLVRNTEVVQNFPQSQPVLFPDTEVVSNGVLLFHFLEFVRLFVSMGTKHAELAPRSLLPGQQELSRWPILFALVVCPLFDDLAVCFRTW